ncbi:hypothetical protein Dimus_023957 [Dionaea muscipula]
MKARRGRPPKNRPEERRFCLAKVVAKGDEKSGLKLTDAVLEEGVVHQFCSAEAEIDAQEVVKESELLKRPVHPRPSGSCWVDVEVVQEDSSPYLAAVWKPKAQGRSAIPDASLARASSSRAPGPEVHKGSVASIGEVGQKKAADWEIVTRKSTQRTSSSGIVEAGH